MRKPHEYAQRLLVQPLQVMEHDVEQRKFSVGGPAQNDMDDRLRDPEDLLRLLVEATTRRANRDVRQLHRIAVLRPVLESREQEHQLGVESSQPFGLACIRTELRDQGSKGRSDGRKA